MSRPRCMQCQRPLSHCLCRLIPRLPSQTHLLILQHPDEQRHALNTARLAALGLLNARLEIGEVFAELPAWLDQGYRDCLLFPGESARVLPVPVQGDDRPLRLIVPDGTWRKARRLLYCNPLLQTLPRVCLPDGLSSRYRLRKAPQAGALSTIEAVVVALQLQEGEGRFAELLAPFEALIDGQIAAMGDALYQRHHSPKPTQPAD